MTKIQCQIQCLPKVTQTMGTVEVLCQRRNRLKRITKRRWNYLINLFFGMKGSSMGTSHSVAEKIKNYFLQPGDRVRIRSKEEIRATIDNWNQFKRCSFMEEMFGAKIKQ